MHCKEPFGDLEMASLAIALGAYHELEYLSLWLPRLGTEDHPCSISPTSCLGLALAKSVRFFSENSVHIQVTDMVPRWESLSVDAKFVNVEVPDVSLLLQNMKHFLIKGQRLYGDTGLTLAHALSQLGRSYDVVDTGHYGDMVRFGSALKEPACAEFRRLMSCRCHICLACLHREGKLPAGSKGL